MYILGLTGSIAMGKSEAAKAFRRLGVPLFDSDAEVHRLMGPGGAAVEAVGKVFPQTIENNEISREKLAKTVFGNADKLRRLESILHPLVAAARADFLKEAGARGAPLVVLDVPLLYEVGGEAGCDGVAVVTAPAEVQRERVMARPGMSEERLAAILAKQLPDAEKRARADFLIETSGSLDDLAARVAEIVAEITAKAPAKTT